MFKKKLITFLLVVSCVCSLNGNISQAASKKLLSVPKCEQEKSMWCWAAVNESIIDYLTSESPSQSKIVKKQMGDTSNVGANIPTVKESLEDWGVKCSIKPNPLSFKGIYKQIDDKQPVVLQLVQRKKGGHLNLIRGYKKSSERIYFMDPIDGKYHSQKYDNYMDEDVEHWNEVKYECWSSMFDIQEK